MASIDISARIIGDTQLAAALARLSSHDIPKAIKAGVRYAAGRGKTTIAKSVGQYYTLKAKRIKDGVGKNPTFSADGQKATLTTSRKSITARQFGLRVSGRGVTMAIYRGERTVIKSGFMQFSKEGKFDDSRAFAPNPGRPYSNEKSKPKRRKPRTSIAMSQGPSLHGIYTGGKFKAPIQEQTDRVISEALIKGILDRLGAMDRGFGKG